MRLPPLLLALLLGAPSCHHAPELEVRQDRAPLDRRVTLPSDVKRVRWVAVPAFIDSGWLEAPEKPYRVYAFCELDSASIQPASAKAVLLPLAVARAILPAKVAASAHAKGDQLEVVGSDPLEGLAAREKGVALTAAIRVDNGLLIQLFLSGGS